MRTPRRDASSSTDKLELVLLLKCVLLLEYVLLQNVFSLAVRPNWSDTMEERYNEMRQVVQTNAVLSVGLCLFHAASTGGLECVLLPRMYSLT